MTSTSTPTNTTNNGSAGTSSSDTASGEECASNGNSRISSIEMEYKQMTDRRGLMRIFQEIRETCDREAKEKHFGTRESGKPQNRCLNRYRDVNPYDHSRIVIHRGKVDYINANLVEYGQANRKYILTQGPLEDTIGHFWLMVWEQGTKAILMLNKLMEKKQIKCHKYWPDRKGPENALKLDDVKLSVEFLRCEDYNNYSRRWFRLTDLDSAQSREIMQFHYTNWPDFGIPSSPVAFLQFLKQVRDSGALSPDVGPAIVHCSAGIGRSGTFCLVDCCLVLIDKEGDENVSVQDVLYELRRYRMGLIQTADQLYFSYQAIIEGIKLLKDPNFLDYNETPVSCNNDQRQEQFHPDETPPPLPPRTHSLLPLADGSAGGMLTHHLRGAQSKPLPKIPASESFNDDLYTSDNMNHQLKSKDALNNFIYNEQSNDNMSNRPLPPLPQNLLLLHESESDENELYEDDSDADLDADGVGLQLNTDTDLDLEANAEDAANANDKTGSRNTPLNKVHRDMSSEATGDINDINGINPISVASSSSENELKRRKRVERQSNIKQKVNEIKRKQREAEEGMQAARKRRSLVTYIAAGVIVGVISVYAYSKLA